MKPATQFNELLRQRTWDKEVVLWLGPEAALRLALGSTPYAELDLLDLLDPNNLPMDDEETRLHLGRALRARLGTMSRRPEGRMVLIVRSIGLLARHDVGVRDFYEWFCGDFSMVVLVLEAVVEDQVWPDEVRCHRERLLDYFQEPNVKQTFSVAG